MSTETLYKNYKTKVSPLLNKYELVGEPLSIQNFQKLAIIIADGESVAHSNKLIEALKEIITKITTTKINIEEAKELLVDINNEIVNVDNFLTGIKAMTKGCDIIMESEAESLQTNAQIAKTMFTYISDYLTLIIEIQEEIKAPKTVYTLEQLLDD